MSWVDYVGFLAALTVLATFCMDTILLLRGLAIASNILFIVYGTAGQLYPVLLLHALLLPINISKIVQLVRKNRFDARVAICCARPARTGPSIALHSLADSVSRNGSRAFDQTTREPEPVTRNQRKRWRRSAPA